MKVFFHMKYFFMNHYIQKVYSLQWIIYVVRISLKSLSFLFILIDIAWLLHNIYIMYMYIYIYIYIYGSLWSVTSTYCKQELMHDYFTVPTWIKFLFSLTITNKFILNRKSKDRVYGKWKYKVLKSTIREVTTNIWCTAKHLQDAQ